MIIAAIVLSGCVLLPQYYFQERPYRVKGKKVILPGGSFQSGYAVVEGADPKTFRTLASRRYGADKDHVYYFVSRINGADPETFVILDHSYGKDKYHAFYTDKVLPGSDASTFQLLGNRVSKDKNEVYIDAKPIGACDAPTYEIVLNSWSVDKDCAYFDFRPIKEVDIVSFEVLNYNFAKDKNRVYSHTLEYVNEEQRKTLSITQTETANRNGWRSRFYTVIESADTETFEVSDENHIYARDKNHCYEHEKKVLCKDSW